MPSTRQPALTLYQVCNSENGGPFNPVGATMTPSKREALAELREMRKRYPEAYLAQAVFTRCPDTKRKGRCPMSCTANRSFRQCTECGQVWLTGEPAADRIPRTCPNDCNAAVLDRSPSTQHDKPKEASMQLLAVDAEVKDNEDVLNDLNQSCEALRLVRDDLTSDESWRARGASEHATKMIVNQGFCLAALIRHMEQLIAHGFEYEFARRRAQGGDDLKAVG